MRPDPQGGAPAVLLTGGRSELQPDIPNDRNLTWRISPQLEDYVRLSYDLIRRGVRFGNN
jgi:hypothetical protein